MYGGICYLFCCEVMYTITIGLEIHIKLKSATKLFCQCKNVQDFDVLEPNTHVCPTCTGQP